VNESIVIAVPEWLCDMFYRDYDPPTDTDSNTLQEYVRRLRTLTTLQDTVIEWQRFGMPVEVLPQTVALESGDDEEEDYGG